MAKKYAARSGVPSPFGINSPFVRQSPLRKISFDIWDYLPEQDRSRINARNNTIQDFKRENANDLNYWSGHVYQDRKPNNAFDHTDRYKYFITIFTDRDAEALAVLFHKVKPLPYEIIFFLEDNSRDVVSSPTYFIKMGESVQANQLVDPEFLNVYRITKLILDNGIPCHQLNPPKVKELLGKATKTGQLAHKDISLKEMVWSLHTPLLQGAGDITGAMADGVDSTIKFLDKIKIGANRWDFAIGDKKMDLFFFPGYESHAKPLDPADVKAMIKYLKADLERNFKPGNGSGMISLTGGQSNAFSDWGANYLENDVMVTVYDEFSKIMEDLETTIDRIVEGGILFVNAFICGFWNSIVSCIQGILFMFYITFELASSFFSVHARPETYDNFIQMIEDFDFRGFVQEVTALFSEAWTALKNLDWVAVLAEVKFAQVGYFAGALVEFIMEIIVGGLVPGVGLAVTVVSKSARIFGDILATLAKIFRKIVPNKPGKILDLSGLTFQILRSKGPVMIAAIKDAKKAILLWIENLHLIVRGVSFEDIQKLDKLGLKIKGTPDVYTAGMSIRSSQEGVWEILRDGRSVFKLEGTKSQIDDILEQLVKLPDEEIDRLRKLSDAQFRKYLDDLVVLKKRTNVTVLNKDKIGSQANKVELILVDSFEKLIGNLTRTVTKKGRQTIYKLNGQKIDCYTILMNSNIGKHYNLPIYGTENIFFADLNLSKRITNEISGLGKIMLDDSIGYYKGNTKFKSIDGVIDLYLKSEKYNDYGGQSITLKQFWDTLNNGKTIEQAAFSTFSGSWAKRNGFKNLVIRSLEDDITPDEILIKFLKY